MSVSKYKFVSPGVQVSEVDNSQLPDEPTGYGPVIIGRSERGPARPTVVKSFSDFVEVFGNPIPGGKGGDVWRDGNYTAPTYAAYAAQAWLKSASPCTFVRLLGEEHPDAEASGYAGWESDSAYGLFVGHTGSGDNWGSAVLAAVFYLSTGSDIALIGEDYDSQPVNGLNHIALSNADDYGFQIAIENTDGFAYTSSFNLDKNSDRFIRKVFNTNPTLSNEDITSDDAVKPYWLGESFEKAVVTALGAGTAAGEQYAVLMKLESDEWDAAKYRIPSQAAHTGWIFSQDLSTETGSFDPDLMTKLFKFHSLETGEWDQKNLKISISDVKAPVNDFGTYGTFTVEIRKAADTDSRPQVVERFTDCSLDPSDSERYVAAKLGDQYQVWDYVDSRYRWYGSYVNKSKFVRVEMNPDVEAGVTDNQLLPFGFYGPPTQSDVTFNSGSAISTASFIGTVDDINTGLADLTCSFEYPSLELRESSSLGELSSPKYAYWGITTGRTSNYTRFDESYADMVRLSTFDFADESAAASVVFTLDDVCWASGSQVDAVYTEGSRASGQSITAGMKYNGQKVADPTTPSYKLVLTAEFNRFTMPLFGGFEGLDITEKEPFRNELLSGESETTHYAYNTIKRAINTVADPEVVEYNLLAIPGVMNAGLASHAIGVCENRGDALAIIDLDSGYRASTENTDTVETRKGTVANAVDFIKNDLQLNTSYGCTYYPWLQVKDTITSALVWMPPSVLALGTFASSQKKTHLWFAPAGFNRGGLNSGSGGLPVVNIADRLNKDDRDKLYVANINPIATFPSNGIMILGQKTLQVTRSAVDRINVRRLMIHVKKEISKMAETVLFDPNIDVTWQNFTNKALPFLTSLKAAYGLSSYKLILDKTTTTPDLVDRNIVYGKVYLVPTKAIEHIAIDFVISNTGASFQD